MNGFALPLGEVGKVEKGRRGLLSTGIQVSMFLAGAHSCAPVLKFIL
jgi:hypothetical protein